MERQTEATVPFRKCGWWGTVCFGGPGKEEGDSGMNEISDFIRTRKKANLLITAINCLVFLILSILGNTENAVFMLHHGACYTPSILRGEYYRLVTGMFLHFSLYHLVYNMICLIFLGDVLETEVGWVRYLLIYFLGGLSGNLLSVAIDFRTGEYAVSAGASGAIFAVMGAVLYLVIRNRGQLGTINLKRLGLMVVLMLLQGFTDVGTDNAAHVGGVAAGFLLAALLAGRGMDHKTVSGAS